MAAASLTWRDRLEIRVAMLLPRSLCYWVATRMLSEHVKQPGLPYMSRAQRALYTGRLRMDHVTEAFVNRR